MLSKRQHRTTACSIAALVLAAISWRGGAQAQAPAPVDFLPPVMFDSGDAGPADIDRADFNGDGLTDVAVLTTSGGGRVHVLLGDGAGGLLLDTSLGVAYATGIAGADFNADGIVDRAVTQQSNKPAADPYCGLMPGTVIFLGAGGAAPAYAFKTCLPGVSTSHYFTDAAAGDFNGDGIIDLAVADDAVYSVRVYRGVGDGTFLAPVRATNSSGVRVFGPLFVLDVNHDGHLDLMASTVGGVGVYLGNGTGALSFSSVAFGSSQLLLHNGVRTFAPGDINNDGHVDLVGVERGTLPATPTLQQNFFVASTGAVTGLTYVSWGARCGRRPSRRKRGSPLSRPRKRDLRRRSDLRRRGGAPVRDRRRPQRRQLDRPRRHRPQPGQPVAHVGARTGAWSRRCHTADGGGDRAGSGQLGCGHRRRRGHGR